MNHKRKAAAVLALVALALTGCTAEPPGPSPFQLRCEGELNGKFFEDSAMIDVQNVNVSGPISGGVYVKGQYTTGTGWGTGVYTGAATVTARVCIVDARIKEAEIR